MERTRRVNSGRALHDQGVIMVPAIGDGVRRVTTATAAVVAERGLCGVRPVISVVGLTFAIMIFDAMMFPI